ncbi:hypothetical protein [Ferroplasma sp.]|uniref:hypothetical protein n=1 Tax=Ferroplasma sp. TaxID=2591003 RepID=UPI00307D4136
MYCVTLKDKKVSNYENIYQILKLKVDSIFVIDYDAIERRYLNIKLYNELSKFFELTVMNYPETESDLMDTIINGASVVVINDNLTYKRITTFLEFTQNLAMKYKYIDTCIYFSEKGGNMYLTDKEIMLPYSLAYNYNNFQIKNSIKLENFPPDLID